MDYITFPFEKFVSCITTEYDVQADSILALYIEIAKYLRDNPIVSGLTVKEIIDKYLEENPPAASVVSVNGKTGAVTGLYDTENPPPYPVKSVNGKTGIVTGLYDAENPPPYPVKSVNGKTGIVTGLYGAENPPPYPVTSVNGETGDVKITSLVSYDGTTLIEPQSADGFIRNSASWTTIDGKRYRWIFYTKPTELNTFHSSLFDEEANLWKDCTVYTDFNPPPETIKISIVTTEVYGEASRHRFLKSALPGLNSNLIAPEAILSVVNASNVPMVSYRFEYDGNYVTIALNLLDASPVTNPQTLTIFYR